MDIKVVCVWTCSKCKKENEESDFEIIYCGGAPHSMYIPLQCTTCGNIDKYNYTEKW